MKDADEKWALNFVAEQIVKSIKRGVIPLIDPRNCEIPVCWDSDEGGSAYEWKDMVAIFQVNPQSMRMAMNPHAQGGEWRIRRSMGCYYKKGCNPKDPENGGLAPFMVLAQMVNDKGQSFVRKFIPTGIEDRPVQDGLPPDNELLNAFMSELVSMDAGADLPVKIEGGLSAASCMCVGEDKTRKSSARQTGSSGCLSVFLLLTDIPVALLIYAFC